MSERYLDHFDPEECGVGILVGRKIYAAGKLIGRAHASGTGYVDVDVRGILRVDQQTMRVRSTAGLNVADVSRIADVADVENADTAQAFLAYGVLHALRPAVDTRGEVFTRDEEEILVHRDIALRRRAEIGFSKRGCLWVADVPHLVTAEAALNRVVTREREIGIDTAQEFLGWSRLRKHSEIPHCLRGVERAGPQPDARIQSRRHHREARGWIP